MSSKTKATATQEAARPARVPKLRFPEFRGAEGWEQTALSSVAHLKNGYAFKSTEYVDSGPFQIITIANVQQGSLTLDAAKKIAQLPSDIQAHQKLDIGDILISMTGNVGRVCRVTCDSLLLNQRVGKLMPEKIVPEFFYHSLQRDEFRNAMQLKAAGGAQGNLSSGDITDYTLHRPSDEAEQQKIAECLSSVDELIAAQARKVDALKTHKKGLMQQLFPTEGETQPRLRFPEFQNAGEWSARRLGDFADVSASGDLDSATFSPERSATHCFPIYSNAVENEGIYGFSSIAKHQANSVTITARGTLGRAFLRTTGFVGIGRLIVVTNFIGEVDPRFLKECWEHLAVIPQEVTSIPQLTAVAARVTMLPFPSLPEQHHIASCLSSLDALITLETQKLEALKTHKKGLMQQLFPPPEEIKE